MSEIDNIPNSEIINDIKITENEIKQYEAENTILNSNPINNRLQIYMNSGRIQIRKDFINKLNAILDNRRLSKDQL